MAVVSSRSVVTLVAVDVTYFGTATDCDCGVAHVSDCGGTVYVSLTVSGVSSRCSVARVHLSGSSDGCSTVSGVLEAVGEVATSVSDLIDGWTSGCSDSVSVLVAMVYPTLSLCKWPDVYVAVIDEVSETYR